MAFWAFFYFISFMNMVKYSGSKTADTIIIITSVGSCL